MRKAELVGPVVMWVVGVLAALIIVTWYLSAAEFTQVDISAVDEDLKNIRYDVSLACQNDGLESKVFLYVNKGSLSINETAACVVVPLTNSNVTRCVAMPCAVDVSAVFDLTEISTVVINKTDELFVVSGE